MKTVVTISGGLDSTYVLWNLLKNSTDEITAYYVSTENVDPNRWQFYDFRSFLTPEKAILMKQVVVNIANWLQTNVRTFNLVIENMDTSLISMDHTIINHPARYVVDRFIPQINDGTFDNIVLTDEKENDGWANGGTIGLTRRPGSILATELFKNKATRGQLTFPLIDNPYNQSYALSSLPADLIALTRSCEFNLSSPSEPNCGICFKCKKLAYFKAELQSNKTPQQIDGDINLKSNVGNNQWLSMKYWINGETAPLWSTPQWGSSFKVS